MKTGGRGGMLQRTQTGIVTVSLLAVGVRDGLKEKFTLPAGLLLIMLLTNHWSCLLPDSPLKVEIPYLQIPASLPLSVSSFCLFSVLFSPPLPHRCPCTSLALPHTPLSIKLCLFFLFIFSFTFPPTIFFPNLCHPPFIYLISFCLSHLPHYSEDAAWPTMLCSPLSTMINSESVVFLLQAIRLLQRPAHRVMLLPRWMSQDPYSRQQPIATRLTQEPICKAACDHGQMGLEERMRVERRKQGKRSRWDKTGQGWKEECWNGRE